MKLAEYLFKRVREAGAETVFALPGDFSIPLFQTLLGLDIPVVTLAHEPSLGYAADAYARLKGFGAALVTYGAGGLNMVNAVAQAYAEKSPVLVISGAPEILSRRQNLLVHHRVKSFESQKRIYDEICCASVIIERLEDAAAEIDYVIAKMKTQMRPGYIEVPRDLNNCEIPLLAKIEHQAREAVWLCEADCQKVISRLCAKILGAKKPVAYLGVEVKRLGLEKKVLELITRLGLPFVTSMEGKAALPETHHNFVGTYMGRICPGKVQQLMDAADVIINIGTMMSDVNLGMFSGNVTVGKMLHMTSEGLSFNDLSRPGMGLTRVLDELLRQLPQQRAKPDESCLWQNVPPPALLSVLNTDSVVAVLNEFVLKVPAILALDVGDILFAANGIRADLLMAPCYYASMGFAVPAALAASVACPERRAVAVTGDGSFQMTGMEIAAAKKYGLSAIVIVLNNRGYETMRQMDGPRDSYTIPEWDFMQIASALGLKAFRSTTTDELRSALYGAASQAQPVIIECVMSADSASQSLKAVSQANRSKNSF